MKPKTLILMIVAVVCGLGASYMTSRLLAERDETPADPVVEKVTLLVAKKNIEMHTALRLKPDDFFQTKQFSVEDAPKDALTPDDMPKLKNKFLKRGLRKGDHLFAEDLMDNKFGLQSLPNGMRAVGIRVNVEQIAGGFASLPMSHVDIIWTTRKGNDNDTFSKVLLEDVVVLAADTNTHNESGGAMVASTVTVALHPDDAMKLALAMETGSLRLVLRNLEDTSSTGRDRVSAAELLRDRNMRTKKDDGEAATGPEATEHVREQDYADRGNREMPVVESSPKAEPKEIKLTKIVASVRNGGEVQLRTYWLDDNGELAAEPPHPAVNPGQGTPPGTGNGSAKTENKDGFN